MASRSPHAGWHRLPRCGVEILRNGFASIGAKPRALKAEGTTMRVGKGSGRVAVAKVNSAAKVAAEVVRDADAAGDNGALGRFLESFTGYLRAAPGTRPFSSPAGSAGRCGERHEFCQLRRAGCDPLDRRAKAEGARRHHSRCAHPWRGHDPLRSQPGRARRVAPPLRPRRRFGPTCASRHRS